MRLRLSAKFSVWFKIGFSFFLFLFSFIFLSGLRHDPWPVWLTLSFECTLFAAFYIVVDYIFKDRKVVSFDHDNLYITNADSDGEDVIPLERVSWLNMRMGIMNSGAYWNRRWILHYEDEYNEEQKVGLYIVSSSKELREFIAAAKKKNPDFRYKNWSWTFDWKD